MTLVLILLNGLLFSSRHADNERLDETMSMIPVGPKGTQLVCPSCHASVVSRVEHKATTKTHIMAGLLCCFLCWPCVCVPYCVDSCQNADHYCPSCNAYLGSYVG